MAATIFISPSIGWLLIEMRASEREDAVATIKLEREFVEEAAEVAEVAEAAELA